MHAITVRPKTSIEEAASNAIAKASQSLHNLRWCEVINTRGYIEDGKLAYWQGTMKLSFTLDD